jgi:tetratricopeptide (TPR) repeat protein
LYQDDVIARLLYVNYLVKRGRRDDAIAQLTVAKGFAGDSGFTHYNIGLQYLEIGEFALALEQANRAAALGFERPELWAGLRAAGRWREPLAADAVASQPASAPAPR